MGVSVYKYRFSIFTSTYNRAADLRNLYNDIINQTYKNFEWVIINDGSTDETDKLVKQFISEGRIPIQYVNQANSGKHGAWRTAVNMFKGRYVTTFDDDDPIKPTALEVMDKYWRDLESSDNYNEFWEIRTRCELPDGRLVGPPLPVPYVDSDYNIITYQFKNKSEMNSCAKIEILASEASVPDSFIFDDIATNFAEGIRWSRAARKYRTRFVPDVTRVYIPNSNGYITKKSIHAIANNIVYCIYRINEQRDLLLKHEFSNYLKIMTAIVLYSKLLNRPSKKYLFRKSDRLIYSIVQILFIMPIYLKYIKYKAYY